jgi:hypothetical protein
MLAAHVRLTFQIVCFCHLRTPVGAQILVVANAQGSQFIARLRYSESGVPAWRLPFGFKSTRSRSFLAGNAPQDKGQAGVTPHGHCRDCPAPRKDSVSGNRTAKRQKRSGRRAVLIDWAIMDKEAERSRGERHPETMSTGTVSREEETRIARSLSSLPDRICARRPGSHSRDPLAHAGYNFSSARRTDLPGRQVMFRQPPATNWRDGQFTSDFPKSCQAPESKILCFRSDPNQSHNSACLTADEGRFAIVTNAR